MSIILAVLLLAVSVFAISGNGGSSNPLDDTTTIPDNSHTTTPETEGYNPETNFGDKDVTNGAYNVTYDDKGNIVIKNLATNQTKNLTKTMLNEVIELKKSQKIEKLWVNDSFKIEGFEKYFEAMLIYDSAWNHYNLIYKIENEIFGITKLEMNTFSDTEVSNLFALNSLITQNINIFDSDSIILTKGSLDNWRDITSLIYIGKNNELYITKSIHNNIGGINTAYGCTLANKKPTTLSSSNFNIVLNNCVSGGTGGSEIVYFSINELVDYSYDRIAVLGNTRSTGFSDLGFVKQEMTTGITSLSDKTFKIVSKEVYNEILNYDTNQNLLLDFVETNAKEVISGNDNDNAITIWRDTINHNSYGIGNAKSEDFDNIEGININGYLTTLVGVDFIEATNVKFDNTGKNGLVMSDMGLTSLQTNQIGNSASFGKMTFDNINDTARFSGRAFIVGVDTWDKVWAGIINLYDYSFSYSTWITEYVDNGKFDTTDVLNDCSLVTGCEYAYVGSFKNQNPATLTLTTTKPLTNLLKYDDKNYWIFWNLKTDNENKEGCLIFDMSYPNLDIRVPVSVCGSEISGANAVAQFKIKKIE